MALAYWCVLIAALLPLVFAGYAKSGGTFDNSYPREAADDLSPKKRRAYAAHYNGYESFPFFAAAVIIAMTQGAMPATVNWLATIYIILRIAHGLLYVCNYPTARSAIYGLALLTNIVIFVLPAFK